MTEFPTIYQVIQDGYAVVPVDAGRIEDRMSDGTVRIVDNWDDSQYEITFRVMLFDPQDEANLRQFYQSYRFEEILWTDPATDITYRVLMRSEPRRVRSHTKFLYVMEVRLFGIVEPE